MRTTFTRLSDCKIKARDGEIGSVHDVFFHDDSWKVRYLVVDTGPFIFGRKVLISPVAVLGINLGEGYVEVDLTKDQVKDSPDVKVDQPITREQEVEYHDYFRWPYYWGGGGVLAGTAIGVDPAAMLVGHTDVDPVHDDLVPADKRDVYLQSARDIRGYALLCGEQECGEITDFVVDDGEWTVSHLIVELEDSDRRVLVPTLSLEEVGFPEKRVKSLIAADVLRGLPPFEDDRLSDDYVAAVTAGLPERQPRYDPRHPETSPEPPLRER